MGIWSTNNFSGGVNNALHPNLLQSNYAASLVNANVDDGKIRACKASMDYGAYDPSARGNYGYPNKSFVKWNDIPYWSVNSNANGIYYGTEDATWGGPGKPWSASCGNALGIPYCAYASSTTLPYVSVETGTNGEMKKGDYKYCVTFVNWHGWEGAPGSLESYFIDVDLSSSSVDTNSVTIKLNAPTATGGEIPSNVWYAKVWRTAEGGADFYCVGYLYHWRNTGTEPTLPEGVEDNDWTLIDTMADDILIMRSPLTESQLYNYAPPDGGKYLAESGGVFFLAVGSTLYFSNQGEPHSWNPVNTMGFDSSITGIVKEFSGVLVFTANSTYRVTGAESLSTVTKMAVPGSQGCATYNSISCIDNAPVWLSNDGVCMWNGESLSIPSYRVYDTRKVGTVVASCSHDGRYYLFHSKGVLVYDTRNGGVFYDNDCVAEYAWTDDEYDTMYYYNGGRTYLWEGDSSSLEWSYKSPYIGSTEMTQRTYGEFVVACEGNVSVTIVIDGRKVIDSKVIPGGRDRFKMPRNCTGRYLQFEISGKGELSELAVTFSGE